MNQESGIMNHGKLEKLKHVIHDSLFMIPSRGFTLVELIIVIAVLGILATGILIALNVGGTLDKATIAKAKVFSKSIESDRPSQVGKWSFEEQTGSLSRDNSSFSNDGMLSNSGMWQNEGQCGLGFGWCLEFDGSNYVDVAASSSLDIREGITISLWAKIDDAGINISQNQYFVSKGTGNWNDATNNTYLFFISNQGAVTQDRIMLELSNGVSLTGTADADGLQMDDFRPGTWYHLTGTWDGTTMKIYKNGSHIAGANVTFTGAINSLPTTNLNIGRLGDGSQFFSGKLDEISIHNQAFTAYQIQHLYAQGFIRRALALK